MPLLNIDNRLKYGEFEMDNIVVTVSSCFKPTVFDRVDFIEDVLLPSFR